MNGPKWAVQQKVDGLKIFRLATKITVVNLESIRIIVLTLLHCNPKSDSFFDVRVRVHVRGFTICDVRVRVPGHRWTSMSANTSVRVHRSLVLTLNHFQGVSFD